jgi:hypothetical protein|tara:strand:- start:230 stop:487 length:258 start_codon:yes stop_codon:yes gene_type:complete
MFFLKKIDAGTLYALTGKRYKITSTPDYYEILPLDPTDLEAIAIVKTIMKGFLLLDENQAGAIKDWKERGKRPSDGFNPAIDRRP